MSLIVVCYTCDVTSIAKWSVAHVLVVEDDASISRSIELELAHVGFRVSLARDGTQAINMLSSCRPDIIVLDLMLPGIDGYQVFSEIRKLLGEVPVIFLTAKRATADVIRGLELGADDYVKKPFEMPELIARIRSRLRKSAGLSVIVCNDVTVDKDRRTVTRAGLPISLTAYEFTLLVFLIENRGRVLSREQIYRAVWHDDYVPETNVVDVLIRRLRHKIDDDFAEALIRTVRGVGYSLR